MDFDKQKLELITEDAGDNSLVSKWESIIENETIFEPIQDSYTKVLTARLLENQLGAISEAAGTTTTGNVANYDPVMIAMIRRMTPYMIAPKIMGVSPMALPTGLVFAMRARYTNKNGAEALFNEANSGFSGAQNVGANSGVIVPIAVRVAEAQSAAGVTVKLMSVVGLSAGVSVTSPKLGAGAKIASVDAAEKTITLTQSSTSALVEDDILGFAVGYGTGMPLAQGEGDITAEMSMTIDRVTAVADTRQLMTGWSLEMEQDLRSVHNLEARAILSEIMATEVTAEINRECVRTLYNSALIGCENGKDSAGSPIPGNYDLVNSNDGRWFGERLKGLSFKMSLEANAIAISTRRGRANVAVVSPNVAEGLSAAGIMSYTRMNNDNLGGDFTNNTYMGKMNGSIDVYVDPYATNNFVMLGYRGATPSDCGAFYCPYQPFQLLEAKDPVSFQPRMAIKTRYAMLSNPFNNTDGKILPRTNTYYRVFTVSGLE